jgi:hypothetical protein
MRAAVALLLLGGCDAVFDLETVVNRPVPCTAAGEPFVRWRFDEGTGSRAADESGEHPLNLIGGTAWGAGRTGGYALDFDGLDDRAVAGAPSTLDDREEFTFAAWMHPRTAGKGQISAIVAKGGASANAVKRFVLNGTTCMSAFELSVNRSGDDAGACSLPASVVYNDWQHVAATFSPDDGPRLFINGTEATYVRPPTHGDGEPVPDAISGHAIGSWVEADSVTGVFDGLIDDVTIYCRRLDAAEIPMLMN